MKWETIKNNCIREAVVDHRRGIKYAAIEMLLLTQYRKSGYKKSAHNFLRELEDDIVNVINNWDIRAFKALSVVFPQCFPKRELKIELTDNGWELL